MASEPRVDGPPSDRRTQRAMRRAMVRAAVAENVATPGRAEPDPERARADRARRTRRRSRVASALLALVALTAGALALRRGPSETPPTEPASPPNRGQSIAATPARATFEAPVGVDRSVFPLAVRRVAIDAGHGGEDHGASSPSLSEKDLTLDIARRLEALLDAGGFETLLTRDGDHRLSLRHRVMAANAARADLFVSIHVNAFAAESVRGVETYYLGATQDPELMALAQRENRESGYSLADLRHLLDGVYADLRQDESRRLAGRVQRSLYRSLLPMSPELQDRGVKTAPFVVLVATEMPAILAEVSCLSNRQEAERLARPRYRDHIAQALFAGIEAYVRDVNQTVEKGS